MDGGGIRFWKTINDDFMGGKEFRFSNAIMVGAATVQ